MIIDRQNEFGRDLRRSLVQPPAQKKVRPEVQSSVEKKNLRQAPAQPFWVT